MLSLRAPTRFRRQTLSRYRYVRLRWRVAAALADFLGGAFFELARRARRHVARVLNLPGPTSPTGEPRRVLVIQLDHLGDAILSTVMFPALRKQYPQASIEVLAAPWNREVFDALPEVDRVHVSRVNRFGSGRRIGWIPAALWWGLALRRRSIDLGIDVRGELPHAVILWLCGARRRVGWGSAGGGFLLTDQPRFVPGRPEVQSRLALLAVLGIRPSGEKSRPFFPVRLVSRHAVFGRSPIAAKGVSGLRLVLHVGAGTAAKRWPVEAWRELIGRLVYRLPAQIVLVGGPSDRSVAREILGNEAPAGVADWTGCFSIAELAAVIHEADLFIGADSGPAHLAAAVGTPAVVLFSGTNLARQWRPCGESVRVIRHPVPCSPCHCRRCPRQGHPCMTGITAERVARRAEQILPQRQRIESSHEEQPMMEGVRQ